MKGCIWCGRGFHDQCKKCKKGKCHSAEVIELKTRRRRQAESGRIPGGQTKTRGFKDPLSTGRKRAAKLYPIDRSKPCEWRGLKNAGGGRFPIIGCFQGMQAHRHHGPVKSPLVNHEGNVHRICVNCHVRWHELNDPNYDEKDAKLLPHQPTPASDLEVIQYDLDWKNGVMAERYTLKSSVEGLAMRKVMKVD